MIELQPTPRFRAGNPYYIVQVSFDRTVMEASGMSPMTVNIACATPVRIEYANKSDRNAKAEYYRGITGAIVEVRDVSKEEIKNELAKASA